VVIVQKNGVVSRTFLCSTIEGSKTVTLADGKRTKSGYVLVAYPKTIRRPSTGERDYLRCKWYALGAFRYFNPKTGRLVRVTDHTGDGGYLDDDQPTDITIPRVAFRGGIPGRPRNAPEAALVNAYVDWMRHPERFEHHYLRKQGLYTDLFDRRNWRLIEAKMRTDRIALRTAVGQSFDYQRCYPRRHPALAVLLPERPQRSDLEFLRACNITAIWRTPSGRFFDSSGDRRCSTPLR
jgi:hypothetical protein